jgi:hypothetical protein
VQFGLRQPFGMGLNGFSGVVTPGAFTVDFIAGHEQRQPYFMGVMAVVAARFCRVNASGVLFVDWIVALATGCSERA